MALTPDQIISYISKAQRAQEAGMLEIVAGKRTGRKGDSLYFPMRFLSAGVDVLTSNHGLTNLQIEIIIQEMIEQGNLNDFSGDPIPYLTNNIILPSSLGIKITDLTDGPHTGGPLTSWPNYYLQVKSDGSAWQFVPGISNLPIQNMVFVAKNGNNSTGLVGRLDKPFLTVIAAQAVATSGMTIYVFAGNYTDGNLSKDGVNYHFEEGYIYSGSAAWFGDAVTTTPVTCKISGYAVGTSSNMLFSQNTGAKGSNYVFNIRSWTCAVDVVANFNGSNVDVNAIEDLVTFSTRAIECKSQFISGTSTVNIRCRNIAASAPVYLQAYSGNILNVNIWANLIMDPAYGGAVALGAIHIHNTGEAHVYHTGNIYVKPGVSTSDPILGGSSNSLSTLVSYSDIFSTGLQPMFGYGNHSGIGTGVAQYGVRHYGNISHSGQLIYFVSASVCNIELNGEYTTNLDSSMNYPAIQANLTVDSTIQINGMISNAHNDTAAHVIKKDGTLGGEWSCKLLQGTRLVAANSSVYCLTGNTFFTFKVYNGTASNVVADPSAVQVISNVLVDTNVS